MGCRVFQPHVSPTFALSQAFPSKSDHVAIAAKNPRQGPTWGAKMRGGTSLKEATKMRGKLIATAMTYPIMTFSSGNLATGLA